MEKFLNKTESGTESAYSIRESVSAAGSSESANDTFTDFKSDGVNKQMKETNNDDPGMLMLNAMHQYECKLIREFNE